MENFQQRKNIRLKYYDYSNPGYYFITICTKNKKHIFWDKNVGETCGLQKLSTAGIIVNDEINKIQTIYQNVKVPNYVVMPNHIHMIIVLECASENRRPQVAPTISRIIQQFKGSITKQIGFPVWQRSFYDHVIRNEQEYQEIWEYVDLNPLKWEEDKYYI